MGSAANSKHQVMINLQNSGVLIHLFVSSCKNPGLSQTSRTLVVTFLDLIQHLSVHFMCSVYAHTQTYKKSMNGGGKKVQTSKQTATSIALVTRFYL